MRCLLSDRAASDTAISRRPNQLVVIATKAVSTARCVAAVGTCHASANATTNCRLAEPALNQMAIRHDATIASTAAETNGSATTITGITPSTDAANFRQAPAREPAVRRP